MKNCNQIQQALFEYLESGADTNSVITEHLNSCESCQAFAKFLQKSLEVIEKEKNEEVSPFLANRIMTQIMHQKQSRNARFSLRPALIGLTVAGGIFLGIFLGNHLFNSPASSRQTEITAFANELYLNIALNDNTTDNYFLNNSNDELLSE